MVSACHQITHRTVEARMKKKKRNLNLVAVLGWWNVSKQKITVVLCSSLEGGEI
jgi:hypothetical protein